MYVYKCTRCRTKIELHNRRAVPFRSPHEDYRKDTEGVAPPRCNGLFQRVWTEQRIRDKEKG